MLVQSNYVDSPIQDCAQVSQVWSMLLFYNHNHRSLTYQTAMPLFCVLCTKGMSQGFGESQLNFNNKANFLCNSHVPGILHMFHGNSFKLMCFFCSIKLLSRYTFYYVNWNCFMILKCNQCKWKHFRSGRKSTTNLSYTKFLKSKSLFTQIICNDCSNQFITQINHSWTYKLQRSNWVFKYTQVFPSNEFSPLHPDRPKQLKT